MRLSAYYWGAGGKALTITITDNQQHPAISPVVKLNGQISNYTGHPAILLIVDGCTLLKIPPPMDISWSNFVFKF